MPDAARAHVSHQIGQFLDPVEMMNENLIRIRFEVTITTNIFFVPNRLLWSVIIVPHQILPCQPYAKAPGCLDSYELIPSTKNGEK